MCLPIIVPLVIFEKSHYICDPKPDMTYYFMKQFIIKVIGVSVLVLSVISCVKDTDFDQFDQTLLTPVVDLNLIFWEVQAPSFNNAGGSLPIGTVRDTTEIRFLDDPDTQESVVRADFLYEFENTSDSDYDLVIDFVSLSGQVTYTLQTTVEAGTLNTPWQQTILDEIIAPQVNDITQAGLIAISATAQGTPPDQGSLKMTSKVRFYLEISGQ